MMLSRLGRAACAYAERFGWAVLPLIPSGKVPLISRRDGGHGVLDATKDRARIEQWWTRFPDANVGIACGEPSGGVFAVDVDPRNDGDASWAQLRSTHSRMPETPEAITGGGGQHVLLWGKARCAVVAPGVDIKADGGYIVAPPSMHPSGRTYEWDAWCRPDEVPVAAAPPWLLELCQPPSKRQQYKHKASVDPNSFALGAAFKAANWLGPELRPGVFAVRCPNASQHSCGDDFDSSTVVFAPGPWSNRGHFHCSHEHCRGRLH